MIYLTRGSTDGFCMCRCPEDKAWPAVPGTSQGNCPSCGCGYLFRCVTCGGVFTFAKLAVVDGAAFMAAQRSNVVKVRNVVLPQLSEAQLATRLSIVMRAYENLYEPWLSEGLRQATEVCVLDGQLVPTQSVKHVGFHNVTGLYGWHLVDKAPHASFRQNRFSMSEYFSNAYWMRAKARREKETA